ncbi:MAG: Gfo/Idh/MocA family protein [Promethearchaeota archaeon]
MLRVGIIGCGDIANLNVLGYLRSQETELVGICDTDLKVAGKKLERWGLRTVPIYTDYMKMIDREDLDIVEILTPHHLHAPMTEYCAKAGVPGISVQKPMAHTIMDCENMIRVCEEEKVKLKLFENFRFYPVYLRAKELLKQGVIGEPLNFRINTIATGGPSMPVEMKAILWRSDYDKCGGGRWIYDDGIHKFSMALWLMDQEKVDELYSWIDYFSTVMDAPSFMFWRYPHKNKDDPPKYGSMEFTLARNLYYPSNYYDCDEFIEISGTKGMIWLNQCTSGGNIISKTPQYPPIVVYSDGDVKVYGEDLPRDWRFSFINSTEHFISAMQNGSDPIYTGEQGKSLSIFAKMPFISTQQNRIVRWDEITPENEQNGYCNVKEPVEIDGRIFRKFLKSMRMDLKKGIQEGLKNKEFKYQYEL